MFIFSCEIFVYLRNLRPYKCELCGVYFGRAGGLRRHDMMVHQQKIHACPYKGCNHPGYKCTKALAAHIRSVHTMDRPFKCLFCEKTFVRKNDLKVHETTHSTQCEYTCSKCNGSFRRSIYLQKHEKRCNGGQGRRKSTKSDSHKDNSPDHHEQSSTADPEWEENAIGEFIEENQVIVKEEPIDLEETERVKAVKEEEFELDAQAHEKSKKRPRRNASKRIPVRKEDDSVAIKEVARIIKTEPLEDGELYESFSRESVKSAGRNAALDETFDPGRESPRSKKRNRRTLLKLPKRSATRDDKERTEPNVKTDSDAHAKRNVSEKEIPHRCVNANVLGNMVIKSEPLEEGEIPESPSKVST
ncbi:zinc finger, C2H2 type [Ancylostoma caninum]|uniref:Zinc finger, C2H2 type n=1 Tax=Ancylostoma caninum TaxID=29170 RepID=A0A368FZL8_ANCCA|nr:zinc finger, C2H2 type [Ancylostoma caninum]